MFKFILIIIAILVIGVAVYFILPKTPPVPAPIEYKNTDYGFSIVLAPDWEGYIVTIDRWTGDAINDQLGDAHYTDGPVVSIHNPKWTKKRRIRTFQ